MPAIGTAQRRTIWAAFEQVALRQPEHIALKADGGRGRQYSYGDVLNLVRRVSAGLIEGKHIDRNGIGLLSENRPEWGIAYLSILAAGGTVVPIDANLKPTEIAYIVRHAGIKVAFSSGRFEDTLHSFARDLTVFSFEIDSPDSWKRFFRFRPLSSTREGNTVASLIYTSGTTGTPKAVELTHENILANVEGLRKYIQVDESDVFLSILPLHHTFEATCGFMLPLLSGAMIVYARSLKSREVLEDITNNQATLMIGVPLVYEKMHHSFNRRIGAAPLVRRWMFRVCYCLSGLGWAMGFKWGRWLFGTVRNRAGLGTIRVFCSGAAPLPPPMARFFNLIGFDFLQGYGMTECSPVISVNRPESIQFGSVGPPLENVEVRIHRPDGSGVGEILVKGGNVTPGYRGNQGKTAELIVDGWLHTGDLGRLKDGHLWITGRQKNVIVSAAGKNIYPEELEEKLLESDYILEALVFGRKKQARQGEEIRAVIVPDLEQIQTAHGQAMSAHPPDPDRIREIIAEAIEHVNDKVATYKRIAAFEVQFEELEKTSTKKVKRFVYK